MNGNLHRTHVVGLPDFFGEFKQPIKHNGHPLTVGDAMLFDQLQRQLGLKFFHNHGRAAVINRHHVVVQWRRMIQGSRRQIDGFLSKAKQHT